MKKEKFKESTLTFFKLDIIQELFFSAIGCGLFFCFIVFFLSNTGMKPTEQQLF